MSGIGGTPRSSSVKDVAALAGVSLGTVSNVLNRPERVSAGTRQRVEQAMTELGFVRNEFARQLRMGTSSTLAYVMLDATNPFFTDVAQGIELAAEKANVSLFICNRNDTRFCSVAVDDVLGGRLALEHLVDLGHSRVACIGGPDSLGQVRDRLAGAREAWAAAGLPPEDLVVLPTASLSV